MFIYYFSKLVCIAVATLLLIFVLSELVMRLLSLIACSILFLNSSLSIFTFNCISTIYSALLFIISVICFNKFSLKWFSDSACAVKVLTWSRFSFKMSFCSINYLFIEFMCRRFWIAALKGSWVRVFIIISLTILLHFFSAWSFFSVLFSASLSSSGSLWVSVFVSDCGNVSNSSRVLWFCSASACICLSSPSSSDFSFVGCSSLAILIVVVVAHRSISSEFSSVYSKSFSGLCVLIFTICCHSRICCSFSYCSRSRDQNVRSIGSKPEDDT